MLLITNRRNAGTEFFELLFETAPIKSYKLSVNRNSLTDHAIRSQKTKRGNAYLRLDNLGIHWPIFVKVQGRCRRINFPAFFSNTLVSTFYTIGKRHIPLNADI